MKEIKNAIRLAEAGDETMQIMVGKAYLQGSLGLERSLDNARLWYGKAADRGNVDAIAFMKESDLQTFYPGQEPVRHKAMIDCLIAAISGDATSCRLLGDICRDGKFGVLKSQAMACHWYKRAIQKGDEIAVQSFCECAKTSDDDALRQEAEDQMKQYSLHDNQVIMNDDELDFLDFDIYSLEETRHQNERLPVHWLNLTRDMLSNAKENKQRKKFAYLLGLVYEKGDASDARTIDERRAEAYLRFHNTMEQLPEAMFKVGLYHEKNIVPKRRLDFLEHIFGEKEDYPEAAEPAISFYRRAAERNEYHALIKLGEMYLKGDGVTQDIEMAKTYFQVVVDLGIEGAEVLLKRCGDDHILQTKDRIIMDRFLSECGDPDAMYDLAIHYFCGKGVEANLGLAKKYLKAAQQAGCKGAYTLVALIFYLMPEAYRHAANNITWITLPHPIFQQMSVNTDGTGGYAHLIMGFWTEYASGLQEAMPYYNLAAEHGIGEALYKRGIYYSNVDDLESAANAGVEFAQRKLSGNAMSLEELVDAVIQAVETKVCFPEELSALRNSIFCYHTLGCSHSALLSKNRRPYSYRRPIQVMGEYYYVSGKYIEGAEDKIENWLLLHNLTLLRSV